MLSEYNIDAILEIVGMEDNTFKVTSVSEFGDIIKAFDADTKFEEIKHKIVNNEYYSKRVTDIFSTHVDMRDIVYVGGYKTQIKIIVGRGYNDFGTEIRIKTEKVWYYSDEEDRVFNSFETLKDYLELKQK